MDSFNIELFDVDRLRLHVMDCVGALICLQKKFNKLVQAPESLPDDVAGAKRRVFWQSLMHVSSFAEGELQTNEALSTLLQSFPDEQKAVDGRSWLPLHFALSLETTNPADVRAILSSNPESIKTVSDTGLINRCYFISMSSANPILMVLDQLKIHNSRFGEIIFSNGSTPLHLAALHSNSVALIKELIQNYPPALRMLNDDGKTPFILVFENTSCMAPNILREFLEADPELIEKRQKNDLPIHCCLRISGNPNTFQFVSILLEANHDLVNAPTSGWLLPIDLAAFYSTVEVVQLLYEYSSSSIDAMIAWHGTVAHRATRGKKLDILKYIHSINPELILLEDNYGWTPLSRAVVECDCNFIKAVYALEPTAISKVNSIDALLQSFLLFCDRWIATDLMRCIS